MKRLEYLLRSGVDPRAILAITFTRKASGEMRDRLHRLVDEDQARYLTIGTFHAVCGSALRRCSFQETSLCFALFHTIRLMMQASGNCGCTDLCIQIHVLILLVYVSCVLSISLCWSPARIAPQYRPICVPVHACYSPTCFLLSPYIVHENSNQAC